MQRQTYTDAEREKAVAQWRQLKANGIRVNEASKSLGLKSALLYAWERRGKAKAKPARRKRKTPELITLEAHTGHRENVVIILGPRDAIEKALSALTQIQT